MAAADNEHRQDDEPDHSRSEPGRARPAILCVGWVETDHVHVMCGQVRGITPWVRVRAVGRDRRATFRVWVSATGKVMAPRAGRTQVGGSMIATGITATTPSEVAITLASIRSRLPIMM
jgi:hypothetical protein